MKDNIYSFQHGRRLQFFRMLKDLVRSYLERRGIALFSFSFIAYALVSMLSMSFISTLILSFMWGFVLETLMFSVFSIYLKVYLEDVRKGEQS